MLMVATLSVDNETFNLAAGAAGFEVTRTGDLTPVVDVGYSVTAGTAVSGTNYSSTPPTGTVHFNSGQTSATIPLTILTNNFAESTRNFTVDLTGIVDTFGPPATFTNQQTFSGGDGPESVTVADLNGDGLPDLIIADSNEGAVSVLMNTTAPGATVASFGPAQSFAVGGGGLSSPESVAVADFNGDGKPDLAVANYGYGNVSVLLNTTAPGATTASFTTEVSFNTGMGSRAVTTADLNGDGHPDLIIANKSANDVVGAVEHDGAGRQLRRALPPKTFAAGTQPASVADADVNGDGLPDLHRRQRGQQRRVGALEHDNAGRQHRQLRRAADFCHRQHTPIR